MKMRPIKIYAESNQTTLRDLGVAAAILSLGGKLREIKNDGTKFSLFVFEDKESCAKISDAYWSNTLTVRAYEFFNAIKELKSQLYGRGLSKREAESQGKQS